ncbi:agmatine deiminase family protein [Streptomyces coeruleoprunus]|uniref:Agmatine deiminase family protein n=1 Tax=Streptomyces coeruleoprunus TaxID=285563 RepID=A0ABV9XIB5_9ACTN
MIVTGSGSRPRLSRRAFGAAAVSAAAAALLGGRAAHAAAPGGARRTLAGAEDVFRAPAEWEPHAACVMAWPWDRTVGWGGLLADVQAEIAAAARTIARHEPVVMVAEPGHAAAAAQQCGSAVTVIEYPINDCWTRDTGPVFTVDGTGTRRTGLDFSFNGWGEKYPYDKDDLLPVGVCQHFGAARKPVGMVLEGGAVITDGEGTLITTEECLLHPNRNPGMTKAQIETTLKESYGATKVIWLPHGLAYDDITNGHVDLCAAYLGPARLLVHTQPDPANPNHARMAANKAVLEAATDARGRRLTLVEIHQQPHFTLQGLNVRTFSYTNYYETAGSVVVPLAGHPDDTVALALLRTQFPGREVVGTPARTLAWGGGGIHCVTQHVPATR